jgi:hypothetical protein
LDVPPNFQVNDYCYFGIFPPNSDVKTVIRGFNTNQTFLGYRNEGQGNILFWVQSFDYFDPPANLLQQNIFTWLANPVPDGVKVLAAGGNIASNGSQTIQVEFNGEGLPGGQYQGFIRITGNDPVNNPLLIPVTLNMTYQPCADFGSNELVFSDQAFVYHQGFVTLPASAVKDVPLRMRVMSPPGTICPLRPAAA